MSQSPKQRWLEGALYVLEHHGHAHLTLARLCTQMGQTKGAFYHHFEHVPGLHSDLIAYWEADQTDGLIEASMSPQFTDPMAVLEHVVRWPVEAAVRAWVASHDDAQRACRAVDHRRVLTLATSYRSAPRERAQALARMEYAAWLGSHVVQGEPDMASDHGAMRQAFLAWAAASP